MNPIQDEWCEWGCLESMDSRKISGWALPVNSQRFRRVVICFSWRDSRGFQREVNVAVRADLERADLGSLRLGFCWQPHSSFLEILPSSAEIEVRTAEGLRLPVWEHARVEAIGTAVSSVQIDQLLDSGFQLNTKSGKMCRPLAHWESAEIALLIDSIQIVSQACASSWGTSAMLAYGTLLGCIRNERMIPNDDDADLLIPIPALDMESAMTVWIRGLEELRISGFAVELPDGMHAHVALPGMPAIDLWPYWIRMDGSYFHSLGLCEGSLSDFFPVPCKLEGANLWKPFGAERILKDAYGPDFRTPNPEWQYRIAPSPVTCDQWKTLYSARVWT